MNETSGKEPDDEEYHHGNIDRMEIRFPIGGGFSVSGRNASKVFGAVVMIGIIYALGQAIANIIGAFRDVPRTDIPVVVPAVPDVGLGGWNSNHLPRWDSGKYSTAEISLPVISFLDRLHCAVQCDDRVSREFLHGEVNPSEG